MHVGVCLGVRVLSIEKICQIKTAAETDCSISRSPQTSVAKPSHTR